MAVISTMNTLARAVALLGLFGTTGNAATLADNQHTETAAAQELGTITSDGFFVYSMNVCTIVMNTHCEVSLSTGAPVPQASPTYATSIVLATTALGANPYATDTPGGEDSVTTTASSDETTVSTANGVTSETNGATTKKPTGTGTATAPATTGAGIALDAASSGAIAIGLVGVAFIALL